MFTVIAAIKYAYMFTSLILHILKFHKFFFLSRNMKIKRVMKIYIDEGLDNTQEILKIIISLDSVSALKHISSHIFLVT